MKKIKKIRKWLWLGLNEQTAKKYQRKIAVDNIRIIKNESFVIALIGFLYALFFLNKENMEGRGVVCLAGVAVMFVIFLFSCNLYRRGTNITKREVWACMGLFMICAYSVMIYLGTFGAGNELAVTIVCLFTFMPTNFDILPIYNIRLTLIAAVVFLVSSYLSKSPDKFMYDFMDAALSIVIGNFVAYEKAKIKWESVMVHEKLKEERDLDILTGIWNRRAFEREVARIIATRNVENMAVIMLDLDKFKCINDSYGHETGDSYLRHFCGLFCGFTEKNSIVGRRSGDEFFMFLYNFSEPSKIENSIQRFYEDLEKCPIQLPDGTNKVIRVSAGAVWTKDMENAWTDLLRAADKALYAVKENGRNNYVIEEYCQEKQNVL